MANNAQTAQTGSAFPSIVADAHTSADSPTPDKINPIKSNGGGSSSTISGMKSVASTRPSTATGMLIQNIQRQEKYVVMKPPTGGPSIGPINAGTVSHARASTNSDRGTLRRMTRRPTGIIIAPPIPWRALAATSI